MNTVDPPTRRKDPVRIGMYTNALLMRHLIEGKMTSYELADATGLHYITVLRYLKELRKQHILFIAGWTNTITAGGRARIYKLGREVDVPKPRALSVQERQARSRAKQRRIKAARAATGSMVTHHELPQTSPR
jgi:hypothetical protein